MTAKKQASPGKKASPKKSPKKEAPTGPTAPREQARPGDLIVIDSPQVGSPAREGEIVKVIEGEISVSYQVRWGDGHETLITPAPGAARFVRT